MLVNWWVEKHQRFFNVYKRFFILVTFFTFFIFFLELFLHLWFILIYPSLHWRKRGPFM